MWVHTHAWRLDGATATPRRCVWSLVVAIVAFPAGHGQLAGSVCSERFGQVACEDA
jgi:hypothetical protein